MFENYAEIVLKNGLQNFQQFKQKNIYLVAICFFFIPKNHWVAS